MTNRIKEGRSYLLSNIEHHYLRSLDIHAPIWVQLDRDTLEPHRSWRYFEQQPDQCRITCLDAERWLENSSAVGFLPRGGIYAVHFPTTVHMNSIRALDIALFRSGSSVIPPPMVSALGGGSTALLRVPLDMEGLPMRNLIKNIYVDGIDGTADLILGQRRGFNVQGARW